MKPFSFIGFLLLSTIPRIWAQTQGHDSTFLRQVLKEVEITGKTPTLRSGLDKKVFSVNKSLVSIGGSAADLLQNIPGLQVDPNNNISLRGATNVKVLVDGRPSLIGGGSIAQVLQSIPAASIEKIEVITSPSAKYDAEGQGIINIILKKGGYNSALTASAGTRNNYNAGASINYRARKADIYGNYTYQRRNTYSNGFQYMTYLNSKDSTYYSNEIFPSTTISNIHLAQAGVDYHLSPRDLLSITGQYGATTTNRHEYLTIDNLTKQQTPVLLSNRTNTTNCWNNTWAAAVDLSHKFKKPSEQLDLDFSWSTGSGDKFQLYKTEQTSAILQDTRKTKGANYNIQLDYTLPLGKGSRLQTGARSQLATTDNRQWDSSAFNFFKTNDQVHAVYINYQQQLDHYTIQAGLRAEIGRMAALFTTPIDINTAGLYPSLFITRQLPHAQQLQLSYTRRINRPTPRDIIPLPDLSDPVNYDMGNPSIRPEDIHSIELTHKKTWPGAYLTSALYYNQTNNPIKHIQTAPVNDITITISENLRRAINTGLELIGNLRVSRLWAFTANINLHDRVNSAAPQYGIRASSGLSWNANITNDLSLTKALNVQIRADYRSSEQILQDLYRRAYGFDAAAKYDFAQNHATLSLSARDIFNTRRPAFLRVSDALLLDWQRITYSARASLTFTWRFGNNSNTSTDSKNPSRHLHTLDQ